jgi:hypothetical protein
LMNLNSNIFKLSVQMK